MSYELYALLGSSATLHRCVEGLDSASVIRLTDALAMVPLSSALVKELKAASGAGATSRFDHLGFEYCYPAIVERAAAASRTGPIAYVEDTCWDNMVTQCAIGWRDGDVSLGPTGQLHAVNQALQFLGVEAAPGEDEFDTVGLGRCRKAESWLSQPSASPPAAPHHAHPADERGRLDAAPVVSGALLCASCGSTTAASSTVCPACGQSPLLDGRYALEEVLGRGAFAVTYRATRLKDGERVCVKQLRYGAMGDFKVEELFRREARVLEQLRHEGVPAYLDDFAAGEGRAFALYLVQELVDGENLAQEMKRRRFREDDLLAVLCEILVILDYLHGLHPSVVHRDIKPSNVMRRRSDGRLMLVDFGSVRDTLAKRDAGGSTVAGTFGYMAPEQLHGQASPVSDLYALGAVAVALLSQREPSEMIDEGHQLRWQRFVQTTAPTAELLERLLAPDPRRRPESAAAALREARAALAHARGTAVASPGRKRHVSWWRWLFRRWRPAWFDSRCVVLAIEREHALGPISALVHSGLRLGVRDTALVRRVDLARGLIWERSLENLDQVFDMHFGRVLDTVLLPRLGGGVLAADLATGETRWEWPHPAPLHAPPRGTAAAGILCVFADRAWVRLEPGSGIRLDAGEVRSEEEARGLLEANPSLIEKPPTRREETADVSGLDDMKIECDARLAVGTRVLCVTRIWGDRTHLALACVPPGANRPERLLPLGEGCRNAFPPRVPYVVDGLVAVTGHLVEASREGEEEFDVTYLVDARRPCVLARLPEGPRKAQLLDPEGAMMWSGRL